MNLKRINELKKQKGLTNAQLAELTGLTVSTIDKITSGYNTNPKIETIIKIANVFNCSLSELLNDTICLDDNFQVNELEFLCPICGHYEINYLKTVTINFNNDHSTGRAWQFYCLSGHSFYLTLKEHEGICNFAFVDEKLNIIESINSKMIKKEEILLKDDHDLLHYYDLDPHGKEVVDCILDIEYKRCTAQSENPVDDTEIKTFIFDMLSIHKASAGAGYDLDDGDQWQSIEVVDTPEAHEADFAVEVEGDSMLPDFENGDIVYIVKTAEVPVGKIGLFQQDGKGYIKKAGKNHLISLNPEYDDIYGAVETKGLVIGKAELPE